MKFFGFDTAYKSLFDDTDDILDNNEIDNSDLYIDEEYIFETFTELYNNQDLLKYGMEKYPQFSKFKIQNINGTDYRFVDSLESPGHYTLGYPNNIKYSGPFSYIINSQELINFIMKYNIIIQCPISLNGSYGPMTKYNGHEIGYVTYIFDNINIPKNFFNNFSIHESLRHHNYSLPYFQFDLVFNNCNIITKEFEDLIGSIHHVYKQIKYINLNNVSTKALNIKIDDGLNIEITNCNQLINLNIIYKCYVEHNNTLVIKNCKSLRNVDIQDNSRYISLLKLKIDKCPNINKDTLILPNHNTKIYNIQLDNDKTKQRAIKFRGEVVKDFYTNGKGKDFKYRYYNIGPNPHMYWL